MSVLFEIRRVDARFDAVKMGEFPTKNEFWSPLGCLREFFLGSDEMMRSMWI